MSSANIAVRITTLSTSEIFQSWDFMDANLGTIRAGSFVQGKTPDRSGVVQDGFIYILKDKNNFILLNGTLKELSRMAQEHFQRSYVTVPVWAEYEAGHEMQTRYAKIYGVSISNTLPSWLWQSGLSVGEIPIIISREYGFRGISPTAAPIELIASETVWNRDSTTDNYVTLDPDNMEGDLPALLNFKIDIDDLGFTNFVLTIARRRDQRSAILNNITTIYDSSNVTDTGAIIYADISPNHASYTGLWHLYSVGQCTTNRTSAGYWASFGPGIGAPTTRIGRLVQGEDVASDMAYYCGTVRLPPAYENHNQHSGFDTTMSHTNFYVSFGVDDDAFGTAATGEDAVAGMLIPADDGLFTVWNPDSGFGGSARILNIDGDHRKVWMHGDLAGSDTLYKRQDQFTLGDFLTADPFQFNRFYFFQLRDISERFLEWVPYSAVTPSGIIDVTIDYIPRWESLR